MGSGGWPNRRERHALRDHRGGRLVRMRRRGLRHGLLNHDIGKGNRDPQLRRQWGWSGSFARLLNVKGTLYGTTYYGTALGTYGIVFKITPSGKETVLHTFKGGADGAEPWADLINVNGTLYGTTSTGGVSSYCEAPGCGTVFSITPSGKEKVLYSFKGGESDGAGPEAGLTDVNGMLYGTTAGGGTHGCGTIFSMTTPGAETWTYSFCSSSGDGVEPDSDLIDVNGTLYGTTVSGGTYVHYGTVYSLTGL